MGMFAGARARGIACFMTKGIHIDEGIHLRLGKNEGTSEKRSECRRGKAKEVP